MRRLASMICVVALAGCGGSGGTSGSVTPPAAPTGTLFVANADGINSFAVTASGNTFPLRQITGLSAHTDGANGIDDTQGFSSRTIRGLAAANTVGTVGALMVSVAHMQQPGSQVWEFAPTATGAADAMIISTGAGVDYGLTPAIGIASAPGRAGYDVLPGIFYVARTNPPSAYRAAGPNGCCPSSRGIAADADGNVYVSSSFPNEVAVYSATTTTGTATPMRTIATASLPGPMSLGPDGMLYVVERATGAQSPSTIEVFAPGASSPARVLGPFSGDMPVVSVALDNQNELYVAQAQADVNDQPTGPGSITVFAPGASGSATPIRILQNPIQKMVAIAIGR